MSYFRADLGLIIALLMMVWVALGLGALQPAVIAALTDKVLSAKPADNLITQFLLMYLPATKFGQVVGLAVIWVVLQIGNDTMTMFREMINNRLRYNGTKRVRCELFDHLQRLGPSYHKNRPQGDSIYRINIDAQGFFGVLNTFVGAANSLLTLIVIAVVMLEWNKTMTFVAMALTPLLVLVNVYFGNTIRRTSTVAKQSESDLTTFTQRGMQVIGLVQLFGRQDMESNRFRDAVDDTIVTGMRMNWQEQLYPWAQRVIYAIGFAFVLGYGGFLVYRSETYATRELFTVGGIFAMTVYLAQFWEPLRRITGFAADVQKDSAACARVFDVLGVQSGPVDDPTARPLAVRPRTLELHDISFAYNSDRRVLKGVTARIRPGEMVAFVGASGAGKSTILSLLPRFYDPCDGLLTLDQHDLRKVRLPDVRKHIALVPQESPIIAGTVAENIAFGDPTATMKRIEAAAEMAGAAEFIETLPDGYETVLTESGQNLSGGQRQRLAIARALLTEAPILILDEPTSGLDRKHELDFLRTLHRLKGQQTIILVTHSLTCVTQCDRIFFLHEGRIAEQGTHEELLNRGGLYSALAAMPHLPVEDESDDSDDVQESAA